MRLCLSLLVCVFPAVAAAQTPEVVAAVEAKLATLKWVHAQYDPGTGAYKVTPDGKPSLRAVNGAVKAIKSLGGKVPDPEKTAAFVLSCHDPKTGAFAEPGGKPDVAITSVGVMAAAELGVPREKYAKAMDYLKVNAKTFEEVRIAAAAVEAWGVKEAPFDLEPWFKTVRWRMEDLTEAQAKDGGARDLGSVAAMYLRLGRPVKDPPAVGRQLAAGQRADGGWGKAGEPASDLESTYRVMRALHLLKAKPADPAKLQGFVALCRNKDGGYGVTAGAPSTMSGVYYAAIVSKWLDE